MDHWIVQIETTAHIFFHKSNLKSPIRETTSDALLL